MNENWSLLNTALCKPISVCTVRREIVIDWIHLLTLRLLLGYREKFDNWFHINWCEGREFLYFKGCFWYDSYFNALCSRVKFVHFMKYAKRNSWLKIHPTSFKYNTNLFLKTNSVVKSNVKSFIFIFNKFLKTIHVNVS